jgi:serine protease Do
MNAAYLAEPASWLRDSVVQVRQGASVGSGLAWAWDVVVTNAHVARSGEVEVQLPNGQMRRGVVRSCDRQRDIAVLEVPGLSLPVAPRHDLSLLRPGHVVFAIGHPFGVRHAVSMGILHALGPLPDGYPIPPAQRRLDWVQADIRLAPGNSGGPIADAEGRVIGLSTMIVNGLALAVPVTAVERQVRALAA